jgi:hypothetical protein
MRTPWLTVFVGVIAFVQLVSWLGWHPNLIH